MDLLVVFFADRLRHVEQESGLAGAGRGNDEPPLAAANRRDDVDYAGGGAVGSCFECDALVRVDRGELVEMGKERSILG